MLNGTVGSNPTLSAKTNAQIAQSVEQGTENPRVGGSIPPGGTICGSGSVVERHLAKVNVASSNLVFRSIYYKTKDAKICVFCYLYPAP